MSRQHIVIGTRGSQLALAQTELVASMLQEAHPDLEMELRKIVTRGDRQQKVALPKIGGKGLFTAELEAALLDHSIDLAVHSAKDLPTEMPEGLTLAATPAREDPRDVLVCREAKDLDDLPPDAVVGTSSLRRQAQLLALREDLRFTVLRGNVDTRIRKVRKQALCDATLLAHAGLIRTGLTREVTQVLDVERMTPAGGQGALAIQARDEDPTTRSLLEPIHDRSTFDSIRCERKVIALLQGGCQAPIGVLAETEQDRMRCMAVVASSDGRQVVRARAEGNPDEPEALAEDIAQQLREAGAEAILAACRAEHE